MICDLKVGWVLVTQDVYRQVKHMPPQAMRCDILHHAINNTPPMSQDLEMSTTKQIQKGNSSKF